MIRIAAVLNEAYVGFFIPDYVWTCLVALSSKRRGLTVL